MVDLNEKVRELVEQYNLAGIPITEGDLWAALNAPVPRPDGTTIPAKGKRPEQRYAVIHEGPNRRQRRVAERRHDKERP